METFLGYNYVRANSATKHTGVQRQRRRRL